MTTSPFAERLRVDAVAASTPDGHENALVAKDRWLDAAKAAVEIGFTRFIDLTVVDHAGMTSSDDDRFEVHLVVYSMETHKWARMKTRTSGKVASVTSVFAGAHNYEREAFDLFGVVFEGHPSLTRLMMPDGWVGHPLRRDYDMPLEPVDFTVTRDLYNT